MIEKSDAGTVITGPDVLVYRVMAVRRGLILKIDTGLSLTRASSLSVAQRDGITDKRTNRGALKDVNRWLSGHGVDPAWSKTYPKG
ncbi:MAG TPA: hypothetical protein VJQ57_13670 [Acidimicrobiia bacterium]|nr:hypothetical protein [Acidimicrobiia bacterium]